VFCLVLRVVIQAKDCRLNLRNLHVLQYSLSFSLSLSLSLSFLSFLYLAICLPWPSISQCINISVMFQIITMEEKVSESNICSFFKNKTIFITGVSGFMGKILLEKLLYCCSDIDKIYILMRSKKGRSVETRLDEMFKLPVRKGKLCYHLLYYIVYNIKSIIIRQDVIIFWIFTNIANTFAFFKT